MIKRNLLQIVFFTLVISNSNAQNNDYCTKYPQLCEQAISFYQFNNKFQDTIKRYTSLHPSFAFSIVAPELTQYWYLQDYIERLVLKTLYVEYGEKYADFSVGIFQMKPSFVENIETFVSCHDELLELNFICFSDTIDVQTQRKLRIKRLEDTIWQIKYLSVFCEVVAYRFKHVEFINNTEKLRFFASAYNSGFDREISELKIIQNRKYFPRFSRTKYAYADISEFFYKKIKIE